MENKTIEFKNKRKFIAYSALVALVGLVVGIFIGAFSATFLANKKEASDKEEEKKKIEAASGKDYDITKCVEVGKYIGREFSLKATDDDIQLEVDSLLEEHTTYEKITNRKAQDGDLVRASFEGYVNGEVVDSTCGSDYIEIGSGEWLEGFEEAIIGMKPGKEKKFSVDVPEGFYGDEAVDGQTIQFKISLEYICGESIVPEYNDEFIESVSNYKSVEEYNLYLKEKIEQENEEEKDEYVWTEVVEESEVSEYPQSLMEEARTEVLQGYYDMADLYGVSHDEIFQSFGCADEQDFKDTQLEELAQDTVKDFLVAQYISYKEEISYTEDEYKSLLKEEYENYSDTYADKEAYEKENKNYLERTALTEAVKKWIATKTTFTK